MKPINIPKDYIKRKSSTVPFGYAFSEIDGYFKPVARDLKILYVAQEWIKEGISLDEAVFFITENTDKTISKPGLWKKLKGNNQVANFYNVDIKKLKKVCTKC